MDLREPATGRRGDVGLVGADDIGIPGKIRDPGGRPSGAGWARSRQAPSRASAEYRRPGPRSRPVGCSPGRGTEKVVLFDRHRLVVQSLGDELAAATPEAIQSIVALLVERVETRDRQVVGWVPTGPAEPFFDSALVSPWRPRTDAGARKPKRRTLSAGMRQRSEPTSAVWPSVPCSQRVRHSHVWCHIRAQEEATACDAPTAGPRLYRASAATIR